MDYRRNEDMRINGNTGANYNCVYDVYFIEGSVEPTEPVTRAEALAHCIIDDLGQDNSIVDAFITAARQQCEAFTGIGFINREIQATINNTCGNIYLPYGPVTDVTTVTDADGNEQTYKLRGARFKSISEPLQDNLIVTYTAGYTELPQVLKTALLQQISYLYQHRGDEDKGELSPVAKSLLKPFKRV